MAAQKVTFFTAAMAPTPQELADIAKLNAAAVPSYEIAIRSGVANPNYGAGPEQTDFVCGAVPAAYSAKPVVDPDLIPFVVNPSTQAVVTDGDELAAVGGGTITVTIEDGVATYAYAP